MLQPINDHMSCIAHAVSVDNHPEKQLSKSWCVERPAGICYQIAYSQGITRHVFTYFLWYQSALPVVSSTTRKLSLSIFTIIPLSSGKHESCMMSPIFTYDLQTLFQNILETSIIPFNHDPPYAEMENWTARKSEPIVANVLNSHTILNPICSHNSTPLDMECREAILPVSFRHALLLQDR